MAKSKRRGNRPGRAQNGANRNQYQPLVQEPIPENSQVGARSTLDRLFGRTTSTYENATNERNIRFSPNSIHEHSYNPNASSAISPITPIIDTETNVMSSDLLIDIGPEPVVQPISNFLDEDPYNSDMDTTSRHTSVAEEDVCFPHPDIEKHQGETDYEALEEFLQEESDMLLPSPSERQNHKSSRHNFTSSPTSSGGGGGQSAYDSNRPRYRRLSTVGGERKFSMYGDRDKHTDFDQLDTSYRIAYYSSNQTATIHARTMSEIPSSGENLADMMKQGQFWIDILNPTDMEMKALSKIFHIHPLTTEDISMEESREKCEVFKNYIFVCFRSFDADQYSVNYLQPIGLYIIMTRNAILTFRYRPMTHPHNVRKRIKQLKDYINVTPDWILYALLDDITDTFAPLIRAIEFEVDSIDELVLILKESEQSDMLRRIGYCRKRMMGLLRLLVSKADVVKTIVKRNEGRKADGLGPGLSPEVVLYLGDVQGKSYGVGRLEDVTNHIITMLQSINHYEKISSRSHSNYLAQISIEMTQTNNEINDILSKLTALGSILIPMNLVTGLWGMNVQVPGQNEFGLDASFNILGTPHSKAMFADDEDCDCPLCMEEFDLSDRGFRPCPCGYQICRFCWHHIKENLNGRCPACRSLYSEQTVQFIPISQKEIAQIKKEKKEKEKRSREMDMSNRKHLSNTRVVQKNLMYVLGLTAKYANEESEIFRQFGKVSKIVISKRHAMHQAEDDQQSTVGIYVTYNRKDDAAKAIGSLDGITKDGNVLRASYGTTKYCTYYLSHMACPNRSCMYLHEPGEESDSYNKENLSIGKQQLAEVQSKPISGSVLSTSNTRKSGAKDAPKTLQKSSSTETGGNHVALPATARWAALGTTEQKVEEPINAEITPDHFGPSLSDALTLPQKPKHSPALPKRKGKRIPRSAKAIRLGLGTSPGSDIVDLIPNKVPESEPESEKEDAVGQKAEKVETKKVESPVLRPPMAPKGWAIIPTVKPETAKPPALANLGQIPPPTRGEKRPARVDGNKRKEKRQQQQKGGGKQSSPFGTSDETESLVMKDTVMTDKVDTDNKHSLQKDSNDGRKGLPEPIPNEDDSKVEVQKLAQDDAINDTNNVQTPAAVPSVDEIVDDNDDKVTSFVMDTELPTVALQSQLDKEGDSVMKSQQDVSMSQESYTQEEAFDASDDEIADLPAQASTNEDNVDQTRANRFMNVGVDESEAESQSFGYEDEDILIEKLLSSEDECDSDEFNSGECYTENLTKLDDHDTEYNSSAHTVGGDVMQSPVRQMKIPPGLGIPGVNPPMSRPPPPFGFSPMHHQVMPPFMHHHFPPGLMPPPGMLPRGYDPFRGQDAEMMMARRLQHSQQMIAALGMMKVGDGSRGPPPNLPHPPPPSGSIAMHRPPHMPPPPMYGPERHGQMMTSGSPMTSQPMPNPLVQHHNFRRADVQSPFCENANPIQKHSPYQQIARAPLPQQNLASPELNQVRSMQEGFRALLPNVNISFGPSAGGNVQTPIQEPVDTNSTDGSQNRLNSYSQPCHNVPPPSSSSNGLTDFTNSPEYGRADSTLHMHPSAGRATPRGLPPGLGNSPPDNRRHDQPVPSNRSPMLNFDHQSLRQQHPMDDVSSHMQNLQLHTNAVSGVVHDGPPYVEGLKTAETVSPDAQDIRSEAQSFFGNFLKQAAAQQKQDENSATADEKPGAPFNDPAIMAARVAGSNHKGSFEHTQPDMMESPDNNPIYRPSSVHDQGSDGRNIQESQGYPHQYPMFNPPSGMNRAYPIQSPHQHMMHQQPPYMFSNTRPPGPPGSQPPLHLHFPMMPPPPGISPEEHRFRMEQFMRTNPGAM